MFRLLPVQILLAAAGTINVIVSSYFASNYVGTGAMSAVGFYGPLNMFFSAVALMLVSGSSILCGEYIGQNRQDKLQETYSLDIMLSALLGILFTASVFFVAANDLTGFLTEDLTVRPVLNKYMEGQALGVLPLIMSSQFASFLFIENKGRIAQAAILVFIAVNLVLNYLFVAVMGMEAFGLALASSLGMWAYLLVQVWYFISGRSHLKFRFTNPVSGECISITKIGLHGALSNGYQTVRGLIVNHLLAVYVGAAGISAFAAANNLLSLFWAVPVGMQAVSRILISISIGEEDRRSLKEVMRNAFRYYIPLMCLISASLMLLARPLTLFFYKDPSDPVFMMTVWGFRILPVCMPLAIFCMHFISYAQAADMQRFVHILTAFDGVISVSVFTAVLIPLIGMNSVYIANVANGIVSIIIVFIYSTLCNRHFPRTLDELMVIPPDFGAAEDEFTDIRAESLSEAVNVSEDIQNFCLSRGIDSHRALYAGLASEEMVCNVIDHGFTKDSKNHSVNVRVVCKNDHVIIRIKDDCVPFDPAERLRLSQGGDAASNIGIRMVFSIAESIKYQNIFGLNVLTIRI